MSIQNSNNYFKRFISRRKFFKFFYVICNKTKTKLLYVILNTWICNGFICNWLWCLFSWANWVAIKLALKFNDFNCTTFKTNRLKLIKGYLSSCVVCWWENVEENQLENVFIYYQCFRLYPKSTDFHNKMFRNHLDLLMVDYSKKVHYGFVNSIKYYNELTRI